MQKRNYSLDILRICACIGVIMIHAAGTPAGHHWIDMDCDEWSWCAALDAINRWSVPVFAMLSGFFFLDPNRELPISKLYGKYILRIVIALIFWSCFYAFSLHTAYYPFGIQEGHFWYLGMCIGLYMAMPIMRNIAREHNILKYFCWIWLACKIWFLIGHYIPLPFNLCDLLFVDYVGYCLWAYYLSTIVLNKTCEFLLYGTAILALVINACGYSILKDLIFLGYATITNIIIAFALIYLCTHHSFHGGKKLNKCLQTISECTFGIYLLHLWALIQVIFRVHRFVPSSPLTAIISVGLAFGISLCITLIIKKIPFFKQWIV